ncbi:MAG: GNAT family N-acetyltransferase [Turicibacter sp.]|nr:GNAT family N-acetyltransferase [Turicibacter sp.]MDO5793726.1 GNAT family N-acetyltransferase [Turicibacter sp.]
MLTHQGTKVIETHRLILRPFNVNDTADMFKNWASDDEVTKYLTWPTHSSLEVSQMIIDSWVSGYGEPDCYQWAIELKEIHEVIGSISLMNINNDYESGEIGYCIGRHFWNQGIVTEAFQALIPFCFDEIEIIRLVARHDVNNPASGRVMQKCGLTYEGTLRKVSKNNKGEFIDCCYYSILKEEYQQ